jgi:hypothetical protein
MTVDEFPVSVRPDPLYPTSPVNSFTFDHPEDEEFWTRLSEHPDPRMVFRWNKRDRRRCHARLFPDPIGPHRNGIPLIHISDEYHSFTVFKFFRGPFARRNQRDLRVALDADPTARTGADLTFEHSPDQLDPSKFGSFARSHVAHPRGLELILDFFPLSSRMLKTGPLVLVTIL